MNMKKFLSKDAQDEIKTGVQLNSPIDKVSDLEMKCDAVRSISALSGDWSGDADDYTVLYDSGHGMLKSFLISREILYSMLPNLANFHNLECLAYPADEESRLFISQWPKSLQAVEIDRTAAEPNLAPLNDLPNLRALSLHMRDVKLDSLAGLVDRLEVLAFSEAADIENISRFIKLETLNYGTHIGSMKPIGALKNLRNLCIEKLCHNTLDGLEGCERLERLRIQSHALAEIGVVHKLEKLKILGLLCPQVEDISGLAGTPIEVLHLTNSSVLDFSPLADMSEMQELTLAHTFFKDTAVLAGMRKLTELNLQDTLVEDLSPLAGLENLESLNIVHTKGIKDFSPLYGLENLQAVYMDAKTIYNVHRNPTAPERFKQILMTKSF